MVVDFHTHMFPHKIAERTITFLAGVCKTSPNTDGTYEGLLEESEISGVDISVALPIVTNPAQFQSVNEFAQRYQDGRILSFGGIHPDTTDYKADLRQIKAMGFKGIKLHPDYQEVYFNDIRYKRILSYASELGLIVSVHAGKDPKCPKDVHCTPQMAQEVLDEVEPEKLVLAHLGGNELWDEVEECLVGREVYFDTGVVLDRMDEEQLVRIIRSHGAEKILFATDSPWANQQQYISRLKALPLSAEEKEHILYKNACCLLEI